MVISSVYVIDATCFDECFLFHVIAGRCYFFQSLSSLWDFFNRKLSFSLKQVFWKKSVFCAVSTRTVSTNTTTLVLILMLILSSKKSYPILYLYILVKLSYEAGFFYDNVFYALYLLNCSTLFFIKLFLLKEFIWKHVFT